MSHLQVVPKATIQIGSSIIRVAFLHEEGKHIKKMWSEDLFQAAGYTVCSSNESEFCALSFGAQTRGVPRLISLNDAIGLLYMSSTYDRAKWEAFLEQHQLAILTALDKLTPNQVEKKEEDAEQVNQGFARISL